jgi:hypothetical protein
MADAKRLMIDSYMTGRPCKNGHVDERYTCNGSCKSCVNSEEKNARRMEPAHFWVPHYGQPIDMTAVAPTYAEARRMNARLPLYAQAILADVRDGEPADTPADISQFVFLGRALRTARVSVENLIGELPMLAALFPAEVQP